MKENDNANAGRTPVPKHVLIDTVTGGNGPNGSFNPSAHPHPGPTGISPSFSIFSALEFLLWRWHWLVLGTVIGAAGFYLLGNHFVRPKFTAFGQLLRYEALGKSEYFKTTPISGDTFSALIRAPELLKSVGEQVVPSIRPEIFSKLIKVEAEPDSDLVKVSLVARDPRQAVEWLNVYLTNAVAYTRDLEAKQLSALASGFLKKEVEDIDRDVTEVERQFMALPKGGGHGTNALMQVDIRLGALRQRMEKAVIELDELRAKYTDINPLVQAKQEAITNLNQQMAEAATNTNLSPLAWPPAMSGGMTEALNPELDILHIKLRALEDGRLDLLKRLREAELYAANTPGSVRVFAPASLATIKTSKRWVKLAIAPIFGSGFGLVFSIVLVLLVEFLDH